MQKSEIVTKEILFRVSELTGAMSYNLAVIKVTPEELWYSAEVSGKMVDGKFVVDDNQLNEIVSKIRIIAHTEFGE